jgi:hypothetical protein
MLVSSILILGLLIGIFFLFFRQDIPVSAITYVYPVIRTNTKPLCTGEKVIYDQIAHFRDAAAALRVVVSIWSIDQNRNIIADTEPAYINYTNATTVKLHGEWLIPSTLLPGQYERRISTTAEGRKTEMFIVTFTVTKLCVKAPATN